MLLACHVVLSNVQSIGMLRRSSPEENGQTAGLIYLARDGDIVLDMQAKVNVGIFLCLVSMRCQLGTARRQVRSQIPDAKKRVSRHQA